MDKINLCQFGKFSCFGCCGYGFKNREIIERKLKENFELAKKEGVENFCSRKTPYVDKEGTCGYLILQENSDGEMKVFCKCHPMQNCGKDLREPQCNKRYECKAFKEFEKMSDEEKKKFLDFIREKNLDWYDYSINMFNGELLKEFKELF